MKKILLVAAGLSAAVLTQSCRKTDAVQTTGSSGAGSSNGLHIDNVGDYANFQVIDRFDGLTSQVSNFSLDNGGTGNVAAWANTQHQKWRITNVANGEYTIMNLGSGKYIQAYNYQGTWVPLQNSADGKDDQRWLITLVPNGYKLTSKSTGLVLSSNGGNMIQLLTFVPNNPKQVWGANPVAPDGYRDDDVVGFFHRALQTQGSVAFDQGDSIPLSDGRALWIAEDSYDGTSLNPDGNIKCNYIFSYRNSVLIQPASHSWDNTLTNNITIANSAQGRPKQVFDIQPGTEWTWPGNGVEIGNQVYVTAGEGNGLSSTGTAFYVLTENASSNVWAVKRDTVAGFNNAAGIGYGMGYYKANDGYVYSWGAKGVFFNASNIFAARFPVTNPLQWTYWNGSAWVSTPTAANAAVVASTQQNATMCYAHGKYILMQMDLGYLCDPAQHNIYLSTSSSPTGPFTKPIQVFTIRDMDGAHIIRYYTPGLHPEFDNGKNELLLTYSVNYSACSASDDACVNGETPSRKYQVKGVRVPYSMIGL